MDKKYPNEIELKKRSVLSSTRGNQEIGGTQIPDMPGNLSLAMCVLKRLHPGRYC